MFKYTLTTMFKYTARKYTYFKYTARKYTQGIPEVYLKYTSGLHQNADLISQNVLQIYICLFQK